MTGVDKFGDAAAKDHGQILNYIFKAFYKSKCPTVCVSVCPFVCSLLRYRLNIVLPPLPEVGCPIFLEIRIPWGVERSGLRFKHFCSKVV